MASVSQIFLTLRVQLLFVFFCMSYPSSLIALNFITLKTFYEAQHAKQSKYYIQQPQPVSRLLDTQLWTTGSKIPEFTYI
jgi:hypothetical protein